MQGNAKFLRGVEFLNSLSEGEINKLGSLLIEKRFEKGGLICEEGTKGEEILFIQKGTVEILSIDGKNVHDVESENSFIGEMALIYDITRTATVRAKTDCVLLALKRSDFQEHIKNKQEAITEIWHVAAKRFERFKLKLRDACFSTKPSKDLDEESKLYFRKIFSQVDIDKNGVISYEEFTQMMKTLTASHSHHFTGEQLLAMFNKVDIDRNETIDFPEFLDALPLFREVCFPHVTGEGSTNWVLYTLFGSAVFLFGLSFLKKRN